MNRRQAILAALAAPFVTAIPAAAKARPKLKYNISSVAGSKIQAVLHELSMRSYAVCAHQMCMAARYRVPGAKALGQLSQYPLVWASEYGCLETYRNWYIFRSPNGGTWVSPSTDPMAQKLYDERLYLHKVVSRDDWYAETWVTPNPHREPHRAGENCTYTITEADPETVRRHLYPQVPAA